MLFNRVFQATDQGRLYHYCSPDAFLAICSSRTLRFSDVFSMNDGLEMHWGYHQWEKAAGEIVKLVGMPFLNAVDEVLFGSSFNVLPLVACFSTKADILSQWRAYAQDAQGFCIGFKDRMLCEMAARPLRVLYDVAQQQTEIAQTLEELHKVHEDEGNEEHFFEACATLAADLSALKNPAFSEESEVRLVHLVNFVRSGTFLRLEDQGGTAFGSPSGPAQIMFRMRGSVPSPYLDLTYCSPKGQHAIEEVILGPRNDARLSAVSVFLESVGLDNVEVRKSAASYR